MTEEAISDPQHGISSIVLGLAVLKIRDWLLTNQQSTLAELHRCLSDEERQAFGENLLTFSSSLK